MSGPKKSNYEIARERRERREREKRVQRENKINEINNKIYEYQVRTQELVNQYGDIAQNISRNIESWITDIKEDTKYDLRNCWRGLNGIENYLNQQNKKLREKKIQLDKKALEEKKIAQQKALKEQKIERIINSLEAIKEDNKEILNNGILQRIELFQKSIKTNPDNTNTLKQIKDFKENISKLYESYIDQKDETKYVANVFNDALNGKLEENSDGSIFISGEIEGVPISVKLDQNKNIDFDTPLDGSCRKGLDALQKKLENANINLGPIKVLNTGQTINAKQSTNMNKRTRA